MRRNPMRWKMELFPLVGYMLMPNKGGAYVMHNEYEALRQDYEILEARNKAMERACEGWNKEVAELSNAHDAAEAEIERLKDEVEAVKRWNERLEARVYGPEQPIVPSVPNVPLYGTDAPPLWPNTTTEAMLREVIDRSIDDTVRRLRKEGKL